MIETFILGYSSQEWRDMAAIYEFKNNCHATTLSQIIDSWNAQPCRSPRTVWQTATMVCEALGKFDGNWVDDMIHRFLLGSMGHEQKQGG